MTIRMCGGSKELAGAAACRWYINEDIQDINILRAEVSMSFETIAHIQAPHQVNLMSQIDDRYPTIALSTLMAQGLFPNQGRMFRRNVSIWRLTPGHPWWVLVCNSCKSIATPVASSTTQSNRYICSTPECPCPSATIQYCLHLLGSDGTGEAEFVLFHRVAQDIIASSCSTPPFEKGGMPVYLLFPGSLIAYT